MCGVSLITSIVIITIIGLTRIGLVFRFSSLGSGPTSFCTYIHSFHPSPSSSSFLAFRSNEPKCSSFQIDLTLGVFVHIQMGFVRCFYWRWFSNWSSEQRLIDSVDNTCWINQSWVGLDFLAFWLPFVLCFVLCFYFCCSCLSLAECWILLPSQLMCGHGGQFRAGRFSHLQTPAEKTKLYNTRSMHCPSLAFVGIKSTNEQSW